MRNRSHGSGEWSPEQLAQHGPDCVFETGVLIFHPENVWLGANVYVGHYTILKGYYKNRMSIGDETWIGSSASSTPPPGSRSASRWASARA